MMEIGRSLWMLGVLAAAPWFGGCEHGIELLGNLDATESDLPTRPDADVGPPDGDASESGDAVDGYEDRPADGACELPGIPVPMLPANGETTGAFATPSGARNPLRPVFQWLPSPGGCDEPDFDIRIDDSCVAGAMASCTFPSPEAYGERVHGSSWRPEADLPIDRSPPVGRRYAWQVRACCGADCCSDWSPPHWLDVGRARNDVNGDGYSDVLVGAPGTDDTFSGWGRAELFLGGPAMDETADFAIEGTRANDHVGVAVAFVGDLDADGFADFAVGASGAWSSPYVVVHFGSVTGVRDGTLRLEPPWDGNLFGQSLDPAGDLDADGYADMVIGAPGFGGMAGSAFLALGADLGDRGLRGLQQPEEHGFDSMLGWAVAGVGDVNGDGLDDLVVTEPDHDELIDHDAWFFPGGDFVGLPNCRDGVLLSSHFPSPADPSPVFGSSVTRVGDVDGDTYPDIAFGGPIAAPHEPNVVEIIAGGSSFPTSVSSWFLEEHTPGSRFGWSVALAGDVDGDGLGDLLIGAPGLGAGTVFVWLGVRPPSDTSSYAVQMSGGVESDFGWSVAGAGDVDGDGYDDAVVGAPDFSDSAGGSGAAWVCFGGGPSLLEPRLRLTGSEDGGRFGAAVD